VVNVTVVEQDRWTRRALSRLLTQAELSVTSHESLLDAHADGISPDVMVAGATTVSAHLASTSSAPKRAFPTPLVLIVDEDTPSTDALLPNWRTVPKPIRVSALLTAISELTTAT
jgi:hypothetical protein